MAVFLTRTKQDIPPILIAHLKRNKSLHQHVLILSVVTEEIPTVSDENRIQVECLSEDLCRARVRYGFMEQPDVPAVLNHLPKYGFKPNLEDITYYVGRETLLHSRSNKIGIPAWQEPIFSAMQRNSNQTPEFFNLPHDSVVEIGRWIEI